MFAAATLVPPAAAEDRKAHRLVLHVGGDDPAQMRAALNNIANAHEEYGGRGQTVSIELVANGPGYTMLRADISPVKARLTEIHNLFPDVVFSACQQSRRASAKAEHKTFAEIPQVPEARDIPAGVVRMADLQEQGWSYIRA